jgi:hemoglobin
VVEDSLFEQVGGEAFFVQLVDAFYERVATDETLRPMYPDDLSDSRRHLTLFLIQYWGGPGTYQAERDHPRLRMRHAPFQITKAVRDAWIVAMNAALASVREQLSGDQFDEMTEYFNMAATQLRNT